MATETPPSSSPTPTAPVTKKFKPLPQVEQSFMSIKPLLLSEGPPLLPSGLTSPCCSTALDLRNLFDSQGFRTSLSEKGFSIYKDSCLLDGGDSKAILVTMLALHPQQEPLEELYSYAVRPIYVFKLFLTKMEQHVLSLPSTDTATHDSAILKELLMQLKATLFCNTDNVTSARVLSLQIPTKLQNLMDALQEADSSISQLQLQREYQVLVKENSSVANALLSVFLKNHRCHIEDVLLYSTTDAQFERFTLHVSTEAPKSTFTFIPALAQTFDSDGVESLVHAMVQGFWNHLLRLGYVSTPQLKADLTPSLFRYLKSGLTSGPDLPVSLAAHFQPTYPLAVYLVGKAGTGKTSFARHFGPALHATLRHFVDPEMMVRTVKQNLNKSLSVLESEFQLKAGNNDLSVQRIIQSRRLTMAQSKPGLVVVHLEEMGPSGEADPNQLAVCELLSQRFSGRTGHFKQDEQEAPRNSTNRGMSGDAFLITLVTSNFELADKSKAALQRLDMFENLVILKGSAIEGPQRFDFMKLYLKQMLQDSHPSSDFSSLQLHIQVGDHDIRPLVRFLRMCFFYISVLLKGHQTTSPKISVVVTGFPCTILVGESQRIDLVLDDSQRILYPTSQRIFDTRAGMVMSALGNNISTIATPAIAQLMEFFFSKTLAPAVVISSNRELITKIVESVANKCNDVESIMNIDASSYKMQRSLYDNCQATVPNLRDDILKRKSSSYTAVELLCTCSDAQLAVREMLEDSPSRTPFSSSKSALSKEGLFFGVYVEGEVTPEIESRASLIL